MGYMHSGKTLLRNVLENHVSVFGTAGERKFFQLLPIFRRQYAGLHSDATLELFVRVVADMVINGYQFPRDTRSDGCKTPVARHHAEAILHEAKQDRDHAAVFRIAFDYFARQAGRDRWLVELPVSEFFVDDIVRAVPDALFVEIVRDPRDVLASKKTRRQGVWGPNGRYRPEQRAVKHLEKAYDPLWDALSWKSTVLALRRAAARWPGRFLTVRYEDLVADPEGRVREVCSFLGMDFDPDMLNVAWCNTAERRKPEGDRGEGIVQGSVGRWERVLAPAEVALCEALTRKEMARLSYPRSPVAFRHAALTPLLAVRGGFELVRRPIRRWKLGGPQYFAIVMATYWKRFVQLARG
jgi:hypothetical protein